MVSQFEESKAGPLGPHWTFYHCAELDCLCYYRDVRPVIAPSRTPNPNPAPTVTVPALRNRWVKLTLLGSGQAGYDAAMRLRPNATIFPVDLYHSPHRLDPFPSQRCTEANVREFEKLIDDYIVDHKFNR